MHVPNERSGDVTNNCNLQFSVTILQFSVTVDLLRCLLLVTQMYEILALP